MSRDTRNNTDETSGEPQQLSQLPSATTGAAAPLPSAAESSSDAGVLVSLGAVREAVDRAVGIWMARHLNNNEVSASTPALNYLVQKGMPDLAPIIMKEIG